MRGKQHTPVGRGAGTDVRHSERPTDAQVGADAAAKHEPERRRRTTAGAAVVVGVAATDRYPTALGNGRRQILH